MASDAHSQCATCGKPASKKCTGCKTIVYCDKNCQIADWTKHKTPCKIQQLEKTLSRTANVIHELFLNYRESTWDCPIRDVTETADSILMFDKNRIPNQYFVDFPQELVKNAKAKAAVLCHGMCQEQNAFMAEILQELLKG